MAYEVSEDLVNLLFDITAVDPNVNPNDLIAWDATNKRYVLLTYPDEEWD